MTTPIAAVLTDEARAAAPWPEWKQVVCRDCGREYTCTPEDDYYGFERGPGEGVCFACLLRGQGLNPDATPLTVVDLDGREIDPGDAMGGGPHGHDE